MKSKLLIILPILLFQNSTIAETKKDILWQIELGTTYFGKGKSNGNMMLNSGIGVTVPESPLYFSISNDFYYRKQYHTWPQHGNYSQATKINTTNFTIGIRWLKSRKLQFITGSTYQMLTIINETKTSNQLIKSYLEDDLALYKNMVSYYLRTEYRLKTKYTIFLSHHIIQVDRPFFSYLTLGASYLP